MQRQSLGSSVGKLQSHGGGAKAEILPTEDMDRLKDLPASSSPSSTIECDEEDDRKASKRQRLSSSSSSSPGPEKFIHIIPILTIFCFLVLYICSYTPSQSDLAQFRGFKGSLKYKDSSGIGGEVDPFSDLEKRKISAIQALRSLQEIGSKTLYLVLTGKWPVFNPLDFVLSSDCWACRLR